MHLSSVARRAPASVHTPCSPLHMRVHQAGLCRKRCPIPAQTQPRLVTIVTSTCSQLPLLRVYCILRAGVRPQKL